MEYDFGGFFASMSECPACQGSGFIKAKKDWAGFEKQTCSKCNGRGMISRIKDRSYNPVGRPQVIVYKRRERVCPTCHGKGTVPSRDSR